MNKFCATLVLSLSTAMAAHAEGPETYSATQGETGDSAATSTAQMPKAVGPTLDVFKAPLQFTLSPGVINYESTPGRSESRLAVSGTIVRNFADLNPAQSPIQYGLKGGVLYSHLGAPGSSFLGASSSGGSSGGSLFSIPVRLWGAYVFEQTGIQANLEAGTNLLLQTNSGSVDFGRDSDAGFYPDFGLGIGWDTRRNFAVSLQTNWTIAPNQSLFSTALGATLPLG